MNCLLILGFSGSSCTSYRIRQLKFLNFDPLFGFSINQFFLSLLLNLSYIDPLIFNLPIFEHLSLITKLLIPYINILHYNTMQQNLNNIIKTNPQQSIRTISEQYKPRNVGIKLLLAHIDRNVRNIKQSFDEFYSEIKQQIDNIQNVYDKEIAYVEIKQELLIFVDELGMSSGMWMKMLEQNQLERVGNKIIINDTLTITQIYQRIVSNIQGRIQKLRELQPIKNQKQQAILQHKIEEFHFEQRYCDQTVCNLLSMILNYLADQFALCYHISKQFILNKTKQVQQLIKSSKIMNSYILFGLLKQLSRQSHNFIKKQFMNAFPTADKNVCQKFCRFVQINYQVIDIQCAESQGKILTNEQKNKLIEKSNKNILNMILDFTKINNQIENKQNQQQEISMDLVDSVIEKNEGQSKKKKWKISDVKNSVQKLIHGVGKNIQSQIKASPNQVIQNDLMCYAPSSATMGGSLGKCLVDIDKYEDVNDFFADLSKTAMIGGSITILLEEIPVLNYFIIAGGLSYTVYKAYNDQITSSMKKMKEVGKASIIAVGSVGSTMTGMMVGGIVIPIPFVGAFIGGVVGGFFGEKGSRQLTSILNNKSLIKLIKYLRQTIVDDHCWVYSEELLAKLGISQKYFQQTYCQESSQRSIKITGACFCIVSFYESRKQIQFTQKKLNEKEGKFNQKKQKIKQAFLKKQDFFVSDFNIVAIVTYLMQNGVNLIQELFQFQMLIRQLVS